jgi:hypothetical protein
MTDPRLIARFAVAYMGWHTAVADGNENGQIVWQDMLVDAADALDMPDDTLNLAAHRAEKKRRDDDFMANFLASRVDAASTTR